MENQTTHSPGDVVNGHVLAADGNWVRIGEQPAAPVPAPAKSKKTGLIIGGALAATLGVIIVAASATPSEVPASASLPTTAAAPIEPFADKTEYSSVARSLSSAVGRILDADTMDEVAATAPAIRSAASSGLALDDLPLGDTFNESWDSAMSHYMSVANDLARGDMDAAADDVREATTQIQIATALINGG